MRSIAQPCGLIRPVPLGFSRPLSLCRWVSSVLRWPGHLSGSSRIRVGEFSWSCSAFLASGRCVAGVSTASRRPSHFLLRAQEKVTKEKDTPGGPPCGHPVLRVREPVPGFADGTSCAATNTRTSLSASLRADPSPAHRASRGPGKAGALHARPVTRSIGYPCTDSASPNESTRPVEAGLAPLAQVCAEPAACRPPSGASPAPTRLRSRRDDIHAHALAMASAARKAAASTGPRWSRRVAGGSAAPKAQWLPWMAATGAPAHGCAVAQARPPHAYPKGRMPAGRDLRGVLSWVTFFGQAKKVTRPPRGGRNAAGKPPRADRAAQPRAKNQQAATATETPTTTGNRQPHTHDSVNSQP